MPASSDTFDPSIQSENVAFGQDELVKCDACGRQNPPNRLQCIYCGAALNVPPDAVENVSVRKLEAWEPGTSIVVTSADGDVARAADLLALESEQLEQILSAGIALPIARVDDKVAPAVATKLEGLGFKLCSISEADLGSTKLPVRISGMRMDAEALTVIDFNSGELYRHLWDEIALVVKGQFSTGKIDSMQKRRLRRTTVMAETTTSADQPIFDLYVRDNSTGYRVQLAGFDYSCLGDEMSPLATENMTRLVRRISSRAPDVKVIDDYKRIRHLLTSIWDVESHTDPKGLQRAGFGKREFAVVHSTNNVEQFTRFSRLQRLML